MPIEKRIVQKTLSEIKIPEFRLRFDLDKDHVNELSKQIAAHGLIHPITVNRDTDTLIAGRHRLAAYELLQLTQPSPEWEKIPTRLAYAITDQELVVLELIENLFSKKMDWKETALAVHKIHTHSGGEAEDEVTLKTTATVLNLSVSAISKHVKAARYLLEEHKLVLQATSLQGALNVIERLEARKFEEFKEDFLAEAFQKPVGETPIPEPTDNLAEPVNADASREPGEKCATEVRNTFAGTDGFSAYQGDFLAFASTWSGPRFNLIHCDFPYGIDYDKSGFDYAKHHSIYGDSKDLYFALLSALVENTETLVADSAHLIFWYNTRYQAETIALLQRAGWKVWPHHLIWHKSDNAGVLADFRRGPRHTHETALFATRGDRQLVKPVADSFSGPTTRDSGHVSEKPREMLAHFLTMAVDETSRVLDPTAGSFNSILAAKSLGAKMGIGVELDGGYASRGSRLLSQPEE
jgi:DNA modification methylase